MPLQWKNVYVLPEHGRLNVSNKEILFSVSLLPVILHSPIGDRRAATRPAATRRPSLQQFHLRAAAVPDGRLPPRRFRDGAGLVRLPGNAVPSRGIVAADRRPAGWQLTLSSRLKDNTRGSIEKRTGSVQLEMGQRAGSSFLPEKTYTMKIRINPVNDVPELIEARSGQVVKISSRGRSAFHC